MRPPTPGNSPPLVVVVGGGGGGAAAAAAAAVVVAAAAATAAVVVAVVVVVVVVVVCCCCCCCCINKSDDDHWAPRVFHSPFVNSNVCIWWIVKNALWKASHSCRITRERRESARERRIVLYKSNHQIKIKSR